jgi:hypothetical protein
VAVVVFMPEQRSRKSEGSAGGERPVGLDVEDAYEAHNAEFHSCLYADAHVARNSGYGSRY